MDTDPTAVPEPPVHETLRELLLDPEVREQLAGLLADEIETRRRPSLWRRLRPWLAGAASALVTALAFFLPSLQEQWDRLQARRVIQTYVTLGRAFMHEGRYRLAEETFGKAFELSESRRLDIEEERLAARVARVAEDPAWGQANPEGLAESDFLYLLHMQEGDSPAARAAQARTLDSYGTFLTAEKRYAEAESTFVASIRLDPSAASPWVHLGNLEADRNEPRTADSLYRHALRLDPGDVSALYDLALSRAQAKSLGEAESLLARAAALAPSDADVLREWAEVLAARGRAAEAAAVRVRLSRLPPPRPPVKPRPADESAG